MFFLNNKKRLIRGIVILSALNVFTSYVITSNISDYYKYDFPENGLLTYYSEFDSEEMVIPISDYGIYQIADIETNVRGIDLAKLTFISDNTDEMKRSVQDKLNSGVKAVNQNIAYMYDSAIFNEYKINIPLQTLDFNHMIIGNYPEGEEMLISETFATELITDDTSIDSYQELIGYEYQGYTVSGIYMATGKTPSDEIILSSDREPEEQINLVLNTDDSTIKQLQTLNYDFITSDYFSTFNSQLFVKMLDVIGSIILFLFLIRNEVSSFKTVCKFNNVNKLLIGINIIVPVSLLLMIISLLML